jgi:hypothetical protein
VVDDEQRKWDYMTELIKDEEREKRNKIRREKERLEMEKKEKKRRRLFMRLNRRIKGRGLAVQWRRRKWKKMQETVRESILALLSRVSDIYVVMNMYYVGKP